MIQKYIIEDKKTRTVIELYRVRVFLKSTKSPDLRITKQDSGITTETQALKREAQLKKECERELLDLESKGVLFGDLVSGWYDHFLKMKVATGKRSQTAHDDYLGAVRKWFKSYWNKPALDVNSYVLAEVFELMKTEGLCFGHRKKIKQIVKSVFDFGIQTSLIGIQRSPTFDVALEKDSEKKPEILTIQEIQKLIQMAYESNHEWKDIYAAALLTGMRSGELQALTWSDVNWGDRLLNVNKSYNCRMKAYKSTKAGYWRQVPVSKELEQILRTLQPATGHTEYVFPRHWEWDKGLQAKVLRRFCFIHKLPTIKFHTLRACFATQMLRAGVEAAKVMKICGWKELKTMQHYVRLAGIDVQGVTESLKIFSGRNSNQSQEREGLAIAGSSFFTPEMCVEPSA